MADDDNDVVVQDFARDSQVSRAFEAWGKWLADDANARGFTPQVAQDLLVNVAARILSGTMVRTGQFSEEHVALAVERFSNVYRLALQQNIAELYVKLGKEKPN